MPTSTGAPLFAKATDGKYHCPQCDKVYAFPQHLGRHMSSMHGTPSKAQIKAGDNPPPTTTTRHPHPKYPRNAQKRFDCLFPGCNRVGQKGPPTDQALRHHMLTQHNWKGREASEAFAKLHNGAPTEQANGNGHAKALSKKRMGTPLHIEMPFSRKDRVNTITNEVATVDEFLNYCPRCNEDLDKIKQITGVGPSKCPGCKLSLASVRMALHPDLIKLEPSAVAQVFGVMQTLVQGGN